MAVITWNPLDKHTTWTLSNGNLTAKKSSTGTSWTSVRATEGKSSGKWYWEIKVDVVGLYVNIGVGTLSSSLNTGTNIAPLNRKSYDLRGYVSDPANLSYGSTYTAGDTIGIKLDMDIGTIEFLKNGTSQGVAFSDLLSLGIVFPFITDYGTGVPQVTANFGATPFAYPIPQGYYSYDGNQHNVNFNKILLSSGDKIKSIKTKVFETKMTSNSSPSPLTASASSIFSVDFSAYRAFTGTSTSYSWITMSGTVTGWLQIDFGEKKVFNKLIFTSRDAIGVNSQDAPKDFNILGSNDGISFELLKEIKAQTGWKNNEIRVYNFNNTKSYRYYRVQVLTNNGYTYSAIGDLKYALDNVSKVPSKSEQSFINHGMSQSDLVSIDMYTDFTEKHYIQDATTVLGSGKVFEHVLDTNKVLKKISLK